MENNDKIMQKKKNMLKNLFFATRPWVFPLAIIQIAIGAVSGFWIIGKIDIIPVVLAAIGLVFLFAFTNIINDYLDFKSGVDKKKRKFQHDHPHPIISNILTPRQTLIYGIILCIVGITFGLAVAFYGRLLVIPIGILGILMIYGYVGPPFSLKYKALGELDVFITNLFIVIAGSYVATGVFTQKEFLVGIPIVSLSTAILFANNLRDYKTDLNSKITTLPLKVGFNNATKIYLLLTLLVPYVVLFLSILLDAAPATTLIAIIMIPFIYRIAKNAIKSTGALKDIVQETAEIATIFGVVYLAAIIVSFTI